MSSTIIKSRVVWNKGRSGAAAGLRLAPHKRSGGTCEFLGQVLAYEELAGSVKVEGGQVLYKGRRDLGYWGFCSLSEVTAVFDQNGRQIHPGHPAEQ